MSCGHRHDNAIAVSNETTNHYNRGIIILEESGRTQVVCLTLRDPHLVRALAFSVRVAGGAGKPALSFALLQVKLLGPSADPGG